MSLYPAEGDVTPALIDHLGDEDLPQILVGDGVPPAVAPSPFPPADPPLVLETADDIFGIAHHLERPFVGGNRFDRRRQLHALVRRLRVGTERVALWARRPSPAARAGIPDAGAVGVDDDELTFSHPPSLPDHYPVSSRPPIRSMSSADGRGWPAPTLTFGWETDAVVFEGFTNEVPDVDPQETSEWVESLDEIVERQGKARARFLLVKLLDRARALQVNFPTTVSTPYVNTISADEEPDFPGDEYLERRIRAYIRWNAAVMVTRANARYSGIGGHLSTYAGSAALYEVGYNHFFRGKDGGPGDQIFFQGHASPGIYARAFLEGRLSEEELDNFRFEVGGDGLSSYPHPRLMPGFWEFPTVSMGLGPLAAVYQARFNRYLQNRGILDTSGSRVWCFVGDGEFDEPETRAGLSIARRELLDNLIFVVNCNLQRLDGPVRGNGKIIQELESELRGNGWNVIKVIWGSRWDELLAKDTDGVLVDKMNSTLDGDFQKYTTESGAYI